jgi:hypothetical protein
VPVLNDDQLITAGPIAGVTLPEESEPDFWTDTVPAAFRMENTLGSWIANEAPDVSGRGIEDLDPNFNPASHIPPTHAEFADRYAFADNVGEVWGIQQQIDREMEDRKTLIDSGGMGFLATMGSGVLDPVNFIPVGGAAYKSYRTGGSILRNAMVTGAAGAASMTASEAVFHQTEMTRTFGESAVNITAGAFLSGVLGGGATALRRGFGPDAQLNDVFTAVEKDMDLDVQNQGGGSVGAAAADDLPPQVVNALEKEVQGLVDAGHLDPSDLGNELAKRIKKRLHEFEGLDENTAMKAVLKVTGRQDPVIRMTRSEGSTTSRRAVQQMAETVLALDKNQFGEATPVSAQALTRNWEGNKIRAITELDNQFVRYVKGRDKQFGDIVLHNIGRQFDRSGTGKKLSYKEFRTAVGQAMRRGDAHEVPEVAAAAKKFRNELYDPLLKDAQDLGLIPKDLDTATAQSYVNRVYNVEKLSNRAERERFKSTTVEWMMRRRDKMPEQARQTLEAQGVKVRKDVGSMNEDELLGLFDALVAKSKKELSSLEEARVQAKAKEEIPELSRRINDARTALKDAELSQKQFRMDLENTADDFEDIAEQILDRITGTPAGRLSYDMGMPSSRKRPVDPELSGTFKQRVFTIEDELIEPWLESDVEQLAKIYTRSMAPDVSLARVFGRDVLDFDPAAAKADGTAVPQIIDDIRRDWAKWSKENPTRDDWQKLRDQDITDFLAMRDKVRGVYGLPENPMSWQSRTGRGIRQLNYIRLLGGMTLSALPDVVRPVMVNGLGRTFKATMIPFMKDFKGLKLSAKEIRDMGLAADMITNSRAQQLADVADDFSRYTKLEKGIGAVSDTFGMVSLMAPWNTFFKQLAGVTSMSRAMRAVKKDAAGTLGKKELTWLRSTGISEDTSRRILAQLDKHGGKSENGLDLPNWLKWDDRVASDVFQAAIGREVERTIVTPGLDLPLIASGGGGEVGRHIFQFKSFALAATQRMLLAGLQQRDAAVLNGLLFSTMMGMSVYALKEMDAGRELPDPEKHWDKWLIEGVDRSGALAWFMEPNNMLEKASRGHLGLNAMLGGAPMSRYASRNTVGALFGPSIGTTQSLVSVAGSATASAFTDAEWQATDTHALRRLLPYQNLMGFRQVIDKAEEGINRTFGVEK